MFTKKRLKPPVKVDAAGRVRPSYYKGHNKPVLKPENVTLTKGVELKDITPTVPLTNKKGYGVNWKWTSEREQAAELLAEGESQQYVADMVGVARNTLLDWLRVPEFCQRIDSIVMDTGLAMKRLRVAKLQRMANTLEEVFFVKSEDMKIDPNSRQFERLKDLAQEFREYAKQIATEKEDYAEMTKVKLDGDLTTSPNFKAIEEYLNTLPNDDKETMEKEFGKIADMIIAEYTG